MPLSPSLDHIGIITRCVRDSLIIYDRVKFQRRFKKQYNNKSLDYKSINLSNLRLLYPDNHFSETLDDQIRSRFFELLEKFKKRGLHIQKIYLNLAKEYFWSWKSVRLYEAAQIHSNKLKDNSGQLSQDVRNMLLKGSNISHSLYIHAKTKIDKIKEEFLSIINSGRDILLIPTTVIFAPKLRCVDINYDDKKFNVRDLLLRNTILFNSIGFPALTIPMSNIHSSKGTLPMGLQLIGAPYNDDLVLKTGIAIEKLITTS